MRFPTVSADELRSIGRNIYRMTPFGAAEGVSDAVGKGVAATGRGLESAGEGAKAVGGGYADFLKRAGTGAGIGLGIVGVLAGIYVMSLVRALIGGGAK